MPGDKAIKRFCDYFGTNVIYRYAIIFCYIKYRLLFLPFSQQCVAK